MNKRAIQPKMSIQHLKWLLFSLAVVLATHAPNLPIWVIIASTSFGIWRFLLNKYQWPMPKVWLLVMINLLIGLGILFTFKGFFGRDASLSLLVVMCALKLLETKTMRDYMLVIVIAFFLVGNLFLFNQTISTFVLSIAPLILLTATLINLSLKPNDNNRHSQKPQFLLKLAGQLLLQSVPVMLILFILFPRIPGPLWGLPQDANSAMTGLSDNLEFGNISKLTQNSAIAFRVQFKGKIPPNNQLYWRGPVLWHQDYKQWMMASQSVGLRAENLQTQGEAIHYTITLEPHNRLWMLLLDMPSAIPANAKLTHDYSVVASAPVRTRIRYEADSYSHYKLGVTPLNERDSVVSLQIHDGENPLTIQLAQTYNGLTPQQKIDTALNMFRTQPFFYTLNPPILGDDAVDDFLFKTKKGFCEHYATSFVYLMRAAGVPARIVTGYQGGEFNPNGNYLIVRQSDAHAWAEVWLQDQGWVRVDPTAAVSPARIEQGISEGLRDNDALPLLARRDYPILRKAFLNFDTINNGWNQWVLGYDDKKQLDFLGKLSGKKLSLSDLVIWMVVIIAIVMAITTYFLIKKNKLKLNPVQALYAQYLHKLKSAKLTPHSISSLSPNKGEGALDFAARAAKILPKQSSEIFDIAQRYNALQYSHAPAPELLQQLATRIQQFSTTKPQ